MSRSNTITVKILGDAKGLQGTLDKAGGMLGRFGSAAGTGLKIAAGALAGAGVAAIALAPQILSAGASMEALAAKSATVFEDSLGTMQNWAKENAAAMGLTTDQAVGLAAGVADLLKPMGFTAQQATQMSSNMLDVSGALSAWSGGQKTAAEVTEIITKAMLGETDGLKALGISISAADVEARLAANGQSELTGAALEQAEALAVQQLIMEKSTDAQAAWADGSMDAVKAQNETKAAMESLKESATKALYPALKALVPIAGKVAEWLGQHMPAAIEWLKGAAAVLVAKFQQWWPGIKRVIEAVVDWLANVAWPIIQQVWDGIATGVGALVGWVRRHWDEISNVVRQAIGFIRGAIESGVAIIQWIWNNFGEQIVGSLKSTWDFISGIVSAAMDFVRGVINVVMGLIHGDWSQVWEGIKGVLSGVWDGIKTIVQGAVDAVKLILSAAWTAIGIVAGVAWDGIKGVIMTPIEAVAGLLDDIWEGIKTAAVTAWNAVKTAIQPIINTIKGLIDGLVGAVQFAIDKYHEMENLITGGNLNLSQLTAPIFAPAATPEIPTPASVTPVRQTSVGPSRSAGATVINISGFVSERMVTEFTSAQGRFLKGAA